MLTRWAIALQSYDFTVEHKPGKLNIIPDILSRLFSFEHSEMRVAPHLALIFRNVPDNPALHGPHRLRPYQVNSHNLDKIQPVESDRELFTSATDVFMSIDPEKLRQAQQAEFGQSAIDFDGRRYIAMSKLGARIARPANVGRHRTAGPSYLQVIYLSTAHSTCFNRSCRIQDGISIPNKTEVLIRANYNRSSHSLFRACRASRQERADHCESSCRTGIRYLWTARDTPFRSRPGVRK